MANWETIFNETIGWNIEVPNLRARVFGQMVRLANPFCMAAHQSDLFYDAEWLNKNVFRDATHRVFYFGTREMGTDVSTIQGNIDHNTNVWKFTLTRHNEGGRGTPDYKWKLKIDRLV